jgi:hypothetical protein
MGIGKFVRKKPVKHHGRQELLGALIARFAVILQIGKRLGRVNKLV